MPDAEHVVRIEHQSSIEIHRGLRIDPIEDQLDVGVREKLQRYCEVQAVFPICILNSLQLGFVVAVERDGNFLVGQKIEVHLAQNRGRQPFPAALSGLIRLLVEFPTLIERLGCKSWIGLSGTEGRTHHYYPSYREAHHVEYLNGTLDSAQDFDDPSFFGAECQFDAAVMRR